MIFICVKQSVFYYIRIPRNFACTVPITKQSWEHETVDCHLNYFCFSNVEINLLRLAFWSYDKNA